MKKSFWGVMLTLAALVMMLGASSAFANASGDVVISIDVKDWALVSQDGKAEKTNTTVTLASADSFDEAYGTTNTLSGATSAKGTHNSKDITIYVISKDTSGNYHIVFDLKTVSADDGTTPVSGDMKSGFGVSADIVKSAVYTAGTTTAKNNAKTNLPATISSKGNKQISLDVVVSADADASFDVVFVVAMSGDVSADFGFWVRVNAILSLDESGETDGVFKKATLKITNSADKATGIVPSEVTVSSDKTEAEVTISADLAGQTLSIDISGAKLDSADTNVTFVTSNDSGAKVTITAPKATEASKAYKFRFTSGEEGAIVTLTVKVEGSSSETGADYGSFTLTPANATSTTAVSVVSTDYKGKLCASADATATALTKSGSFTAEDVTTFTLTFKATDGEDGSISIADVYDVSDTSDIVSVSDDVLESNVITPAVAGSYRILFKAASTDTTTAADAEYFTVNFTLEEDDSDDDTPEPINDSTLTDSSKAVSDFNNSTSGAVSESEIAALDSDTSIEGRALKAGYADFFTAAGVTTLADLLDYVPPTGGFTYPQYALMKLTTEPAEGDTIIVRLMTASAIGADPTSSSTTYAGTFVSKAASQYIIIDTYNLRQPSTPTSTLTLPEGIYAILAQIYIPTTNTESVSIAATADGMARLDAEGYSGNVASKITGSNKGSSSGCDAGFGALALLALALPLVKKFSK